LWPKIMLITLRMRIIALVPSKLQKRIRAYLWVRTQSVPCGAQRLYPNIRGAVYTHMTGCEPSKDSYPPGVPIERSPEHKSTVIWHTRTPGVPVTGDRGIGPKILIETVAKGIIQLPR
jgi:hypothetical protein